MTQTFGTTYSIDIINVCRSGEDICNVQHNMYYTYGIKYIKSVFL